MTRLTLSIIHTDTLDGPKDFVTYADKEIVFQRGLIGQGIVGVLLRPLEPGEAVAPANFGRNRAFVDFLQEVIARRGPELPGLIAEAQDVRNGVVVVVDQRTRTLQGDIPPEDILGVFKVKDGQVIPGSYTASPNHVLLTQDGFFRLPAEFEACLVAELMKLYETDAPLPKDEHA